MKYTIVHINDRSKENMDYNKSILSTFKYVDSIEFFNGNKGNAWDVINHKGIRQDVWKPYDGRSFPPLPGELGVWVSTINVWEHIVDNNIDMFLMLEDDVRLSKDFVADLQLCLNDLPKDFDFLSLYYFEEQNDFNEKTNIGSQYIHKALTQYSAGQATIYSFSGAKKLLKVLKRKGIEYTADCFIFRQCHEEVINGYSIVPKNLSFLEHDYINIQSTIDPENKRNVWL
jgi:GR25 family glycosyltransferase involved in LPS biosynthesis